MSAVLTLPRGAQLCHLPSPFRLAGGGELHGAVVAYQLTGPRDAPLVVALGGISAHRDAECWWSGVVGAGAAIDPARHRVLSIDWLGGAGCTTAPARGEAFPSIATADQADALAHVLDGLGIARVHALIGASYGGMVGLQFAARHGERLERLAVIAAADRSHPQASAWRWVQRRIVELADRGGDGAEGLALARALAMTTYRSPTELLRRFAEPSAVTNWIAARGVEFASRFLPEQFLCLNASIDAHRVDPDAVHVPTTLVAFDSDLLVPATDVQRLAERLPALVRYCEVPSLYGHDGFLKEAAALGRILREVLS